MSIFRLKTLKKKNIEPNQNFTGSYKTESHVPGHKEI